jgi:hypothetical protein
MEKYRASDINSGSAAAEMQTSVIQSTSALDAWQDFIAEYEAELDDGKATFSQDTAVQQTVEQEYSTYVMGAPSSGTMLDTLNFWQASTF